MTNKNQFESNEHLFPFQSTNNQCNKRYENWDWSDHVNIIGELKNECFGLYLLKSFHQLCPYFIYRLPISPNSYATHTKYSLYVDVM